MTAIVSGGTNQTTAYVFGVGGTAGTNLFSNDLIAKTEYPDPSTGAASTSAANDVSNTYDLQGDIVTMKDQNGTTHTYSYDLLGRQTSDSITVATGNPQGIDTSIIKHATSYTDLGLVYQQTSLNSSSVVVNQLQYAYDGFGQQTVEYEEHSGAVNTSTSNLYQHYYAEGVGNSDRLLGFGYNSGRIIDYVYGGQFAISSITHSGTTATVTSDTPHGLLVGTKVTISGASPSAYDGTFTITAVTDATHFTYTTATTPGSNASGGAMLGTGTPQLPVTSITHSGTTATITLPSGLLSGLSTGATFSAEISGATPSVYDGTFTVTVASSTSLTYATSTTPGSNASGVDIVMLSPTTTLDSAISRPDGIIDDTGGTAGDVLEGYSYIGLNTIVIRNRPEETTQLAYVQQSGDTLASSDGGDEYTGLDRFGRIIDQYWLDFGTGSALDRFQYAYDRNGNVLYENNLLDSAYSQLYHANSATSGDNNTAYDDINRLVDFQMGTLSSSGNNGSTLDKITSPSQTESFTLDGVGNWSDFNDSTTSDQTAAFNARNQYTSLSGGSATATPTYDYDGNMVTDQAGLHYKYDAWNQLVVLKASNNTTVLLTLAENALGQIFNYNDGVNAGQWNYNGNQVISYLTNVWSQMVWGLGYTNDLILRDRDADNNLSTGTYGYGTGQEERIYAQQDANYNVTSLYDLSTSGITERLVYDPYGKSTTLTAAWAAQTDTTILWKYRFQGTDFEATGGFNVMGARLQSVALGRWLQEDPSGYRDNANLFAAFDSSPVNNYDPTGLVSISMFWGPDLLNDQSPGFYLQDHVDGLKPGHYYAQVWQIQTEGTAGVKAALASSFTSGGSTTGYYTGHYVDYETLIDLMVTADGPDPVFKPRRRGQYGEGGNLQIDTTTGFVDEVSPPEFPAYEETTSGTCTGYDLGTALPQGAGPNDNGLAQLTVPDPGGVTYHMDGNSKFDAGFLNSKGVGKALSDDWSWSFTYQYANNLDTLDHKTHESLWVDPEVQGGGQWYYVGGKRVTSDSVYVQYPNPIDYGQDYYFRPNGGKKTQ